MSPNKFRFFLLSKLPIAYIAGLHLIEFLDSRASISIRLKWLNQNPFNSIFWAVQGMAAELSTGVLCISKIKNSGKNISMLVIKQEAVFTKKAKGKIVFTCTQGNEIDTILKECIETNEGRTLVLTSKGIDEQGDMVSEFHFTWSFKVK